MINRYACMLVCYFIKTLKGQSAPCLKTSISILVVILYILRTILVRNIYLYLPPPRLALAYKANAYLLEHVLIKVGLFYKKEDKKKTPPFRGG